MVEQAEKVEPVLVLTVEGVAVVPHFRVRLVTPVVMVLLIQLIPAEQVVQERVLEEGVVMVHHRMMQQPVLHLAARAGLIEATQPPAPGYCDGAVEPCRAQHHPSVSPHPPTPRGDP